MLGRILLIGTIVTGLPACSLLAPIQGPNGQEGYIQTKSVADQDPYWRRFYELEREIAQLKASNAQLQQQIRPVESVYTSPAPQPEVKVESTSVVDELIASVRVRADRAIAAIDEAMVSLSSPGTAKSEPVRNVAQIDIPDIQGNLIRNADGDVVKHTTYSAARKSRYNYSVVYVYPEPAPWNEMWSRLDAANEQDKWRGFNPDRASYFIYVGAYVNQQDAEQRQDSLFVLVGEKPDLRQRVQNHALAAK